MGLEEGDRTGRRGLFAVTKDIEDNTTDTIQPLDTIISTIISYQEGKFPEVPDQFYPILNRLQRDAEIYGNQKQNFDEISNELNALKEEYSSVKKEHEFFLTDLISAHTEFDRALEIFQYHTIPMVLTGSDSQIVDANDVFCTLFSVERSEITQQFPLLSKYLPDQVPFTAPDGKEYSTILIKPPIVPFDHEAVSLSLLIPFVHPEEIKVKEVLSSSIISRVLTEILLPIAIVDEYNLIQYANDAFANSLSRSILEIHLRDIGSCGIHPEISQKIEEVKDSGIRQDVQTTITLRDNSTLPVWVQIIPLFDEEDNKLLIVLFPDEEDNSIPVSEEIKPSPLSDTFLKTLIDLNPSPIVLFDDMHHILLVNEGLSELIGVSADQLNGQTLADVGLHIPETGFTGEDIEVLPEDICIESPYGEQCYSGLLISHNAGKRSNHILILQPPLDSELIEQNITESVEEIVLTPVSKIIEDEKKTVILSSNDWNSSPVPLVTIEGPVVTGINDGFTRWSGITRESMQEYAAGLISHSVQSIGNPDLVFSSVMPSGLKTYQLVVQYLSEENDTRLCWFIDQTEAYATITALREQIEKSSFELTSLRNSLSDDQQARNLVENLSDQIDIVEFELSGGRYAMDIGMVREVVEMLPITPLPKTPPYIIGIINLRGEVTHVVDLGILLGEGVKKDRSGQKIIIVPPDAAHGEHLGIIVDNVRSVTEIGTRQVTSLGEEINTRINTRIKGIIKVTQDDLIEKREGEEKEGNLVIWLDMKEILNRLAGFQ